MPFQAQPTERGAGGVPTTLSTVAAATTTGSFTPYATTSGAVQANRLLVSVYSWHATVAFTNTTTITDTLGLTWTKLANVQENGGLEQLTVFISDGVASATGTVTCTLSQAAGGGVLSVLDLRDVNAATPVLQAVTGHGTGTSGPVTVGSYTSVNMLISIWGHFVNEAVTPDATPAWTEVVDAGTTTSRLEIQYHFNGPIDLTPDASWATSSRWVGVVLEMAPSAFIGSDRGHGDVYGAGVGAHTRDGVRVLAAVGSRTRLEARPDCLRWLGPRLDDDCMDSGGGGGDTDASTWSWLG